MAKGKQAKLEDSLAESSPAANPGAGSIESDAASRDVFDQALAARQSQANREPHGDTEMEPAARNGITRRQYQKAPDPRGQHIIMLSPDPKGPKARLLRSEDHGDMWLQFSEKPDAEIISQLKEAGLRWEPRAHSDFARGAWVIELEPGEEWRNAAHAEKVFQSVVNEIRARNGMEEFVPGAGQGV